MATVGRAGPDAAADTAGRPAIAGVGDADSVLGDRARSLIDTQELGWRAKGLPLDGRFAVAEDLRAARSSLFDAGFVTPVATLRASALEANLRAMAEYCAASTRDASSVLFAPHGKTTMSPQLFDAQLAHGAWGITLATPWQLRVAVEFGIPRMLLANELVDPAALGWVADTLLHDPDVTLLSYVDDLDVVDWGGELLAAHGAPRPLDVLLEVGYHGGRTGVRGAAAVDTLAAAVDDSPAHRLAGVAGYEGGFGHDATPETIAGIREHLREVRASAERLDAAGLLPGERVVLTAGGSSFFDLVVDELSGALSSGRPVDVIIRSGGVISHDEGLYGEVSPFVRRPELRELSGGALEAPTEIWARVLSRPEEELALLDVGRRDVPYDQRMPSVHRAFHAPGAQAPTTPAAMEALADADGWEVLKVDDQHGYLRLPATSPLASGDLVVLGITHPCTFFDKWRALPVVDDDGLILDVVHTYF